MVGYVYLILSDELGAYKIGVSKNDPNQRLRKLSTGNPDALVMINFFQSQNPYKLEKWLHRKYDHKRGDGEWFYLEEDDIKSFIATCTEIDEIISLLKRENPFFN